MNDKVFDGVHHLADRDEQRANLVIFRVCDVGRHIGIQITGADGFRIGCHLSDRRSKTYDGYNDQKNLRQSHDDKGVKHHVEEAACLFIDKGFRRYLD